MTGFIEPRSLGCVCVCCVGKCCVCVVEGLGLGDGEVFVLEIMLVDILCFLMLGYSLRTTPREEWFSRHATKSLLCE